MTNNFNGNSNNNNSVATGGGEVMYRVEQSDDATCDGLSTMEGSRRMLLRKGNKNKRRREKKKNYCFSMSVYDFRRRVASSKNELNQQTAGKKLFYGRSLYTFRHVCTIQEIFTMVFLCDLYWYGSSGRTEHRKLPISLVATNPPTVVHSRSIFNL